MSLSVKTWTDLLEGLRSYVGFKLRGSGFNHILSTPYRRNYASDPKSFRGAGTCLKSSITMPSLVGFGFHPPPGGPKTLSFLFVCLSVCLFVTLLNVRVCAPCFAMKALEYRNNFDAIGYGKVVVVHPCSTLSDCCQLATTLNAEVQKTRKIDVFRHQRAKE